MYQIRCDGYILFDPRDDSLVVFSPKCKLKVNTVGEGSFTILPNHIYYDKLKKLKSVFEIRESNQVIFRGRMTNDSRDFNNLLYVDLEGMLGVTNDTIIPPFNFPEDFEEAASAANVVEYFLQWILDQHNSNVSDWQKLKLGNVTVADPNNYITRSSEKYSSTWDTLKTKLFESALGGYLCIRYEDDGNYIDYLSSFDLTNTQRITFGKNLLDITNQSDASETYSAILPIGKDGLVLEDLPDGGLTDDLVKEGVYIYSKSARAEYGWVCMPVEKSTWDDVTEADNLQTKAMSSLGESGVMLSNTITAKAVDLHFTDEEIQSFRIYRNILVDSPPHGVEGAIYPLTELDIDITSPQNTIITIGDTVRTLIDEQNSASTNATQKIESVTNNLKSEVADVKESVVNLKGTVEGIEGSFFYIRYSAYSDGHVMTISPQTDTLYMGTCSTSEQTAPTDYTKYTWCRVKGDQGETGADGKTQYLHIKYSDDGETFTANSGETLGAYIGTLVDFNEADSTTFSDYTWKKFTEDVDDELEEIRTSITKAKTEVLNDCNEIILTALKNYVETGNYDSFKEAVETTLKVLAGQIEMNFKTTTEEISNVNGDLRSKFNEVYNYIRFIDGSIVLGSSESAITLTIENDVISFKKNGVQFGYWDGDDFHTGNIVVEVNERAQFGNFAFIPREDGSLSFLKVR